MAPTASRIGRLGHRPAMGPSGPGPPESGGWDLWGHPGRRRGRRMSTDPAAGGALSRAPCPACRSTSASLPRTCSTSSNIRARGITIRHSSVLHLDPRPMDAIALRSARPEGPPPPPATLTKRRAPASSPPTMSQDVPPRHPGFPTTTAAHELPDIHPFESPDYSWRCSRGRWGGTEVPRLPRQVGDGNRASRPR
jgi:hypothetical protein